MDQSTEQIILEAAAAQFAAKGYGGARVEEIAAAAGVNKATLYYQIGDKAVLYGRVIDDLLRSVADRITAALAAEQDPEQKVRAYVREFAASARECQPLAPILMREVAGGGANLPDSALLQMGRIVNALDQAVRAGIASGVFRDVNPFIAHMLVVGSLSFFNAGAPIRARVAASQGLAFQPEVNMNHDEMTAQLSAMVLGAFRNA
ncbi:MAG: TetR/AcrR family transcriptional regulator [Sideroxyarcus sp.]|nr:TetR/AcrR family transcriptional regulator [Sideroxyarcus sp.]